MDIVERRRVQNRDAQRRFRSKRLSNTPTHSRASYTSYSPEVTGADTRIQPHSSLPLLLPSPSPSPSAFPSSLSNIEIRQSPWPGPGTNFLHTCVEGEKSDTTKKRKHTSGGKNQRVTPLRTPVGKDSLGTSRRSLTDQKYTNELSSNHVTQFRDVYNSSSYKLNPETVLADLSPLPMPDGPSEAIFWSNRSPQEQTPHSSASDSISYGGERVAASSSYGRRAAPHHSVHGQIVRNYKHPGTPLSPSLPSLLGLSMDGSNSGSDAVESDNDVAKDVPFQTSLHIAASCGQENMIDMILGGGTADVDEPDSDANTALHLAIKGGCPVVAERLLGYGADPNAENAAGWTPVHIAVSSGSVELVSLLVRHGGDIARKTRGR